MSYSLATDMVLFINFSPSACFGGTLSCWHLCTAAVASGQIHCWTHLVVHLHASRTTTTVRAMESMHIAGFVLLFLTYIQDVVSFPLNSTLVISHVHCSLIVLLPDYS
jgi:hypothetical protein